MLHISPTAITLVLGKAHSTERDAIVTGMARAHLLTLHARFTGTLIVCIVLGLGTTLGALGTGYCNVFTHLPTG